MNRDPHSSFHVMDWLRKLRFQFLGLFRKRKFETEMAQEMKIHLENEVRRNIGGGMSLEEAHHEAQRRFGGVDQIKEQARDQRSWMWLEQLTQDLRFAARSLRKKPSFAAVAIITLALGIGASTAIFTAVNAVMLRPLPVSAPSGLTYATSGDTERFSSMLYERLHGDAKSFAGFAAFQEGGQRRELVAPGATEADLVTTQLVTGNYFSVLGATAVVGRVFGPDDDRPGAAQPVAVISHAFWQRRFGADASVVGQVVQVGKVSISIIGVMPPGLEGFQIGNAPDLWLPMQLGPQVDPNAREWLASETLSWLILFGRLREGVSREQAETEANAIFRQQLMARVSRDAAMAPATRERILRQTFQLQPGAAGYLRLRSQFKQPLLILLAAVGAVLLIACTNVAGLMLARGATRQREFALRAALGAGRGRIVRQLITESVLLAVVGGAVGLIFAYWGTSFLTSHLSQTGNNFVLKPDGWVLLFVIAVSLFTGVLFGLAPALRLSRFDLVSVIKSQVGQAGGSQQRLQPTLVVMQIVLSVVLLSAAGLFTQTLRNLRTLNLGFRPEDVVSFTVSPSRWRPDADQLDIMWRRILSELETAHGVRGVSIGGTGMLSGNAHNLEFSIDGYTPASDEEMRAPVVLAGPRFFETLKIPLRGREFRLSDEPASVAGSPPKMAPVVILSETMAKKFFGSADPIGRFITLKLGNGTRLEVIGVASDTKYSRNLRERTPPLEIYQPYFGAWLNPPPTFYVRTDQSAAGFSSEIRNLVTRIEPRLAVGALRPLDETIERLLVRERVIAQLVGFFSSFALLLASLGIYGMLSYGVAQRTREIGLRMALGATLHGIIGLVLKQGIKLTLIGCVVGIAGASLLSRLIETQLYGVKPTDLVTFVTVTGLLLTVALLACWLPARRAAKVDPMIALRTDG